MCLNQFNLMVTPPDFELVEKVFLDIQKIIINVKLRNTVLFEWICILFLYIILPFYIFVQFSNKNIKMYFISSVGELK